MREFLPDIIEDGVDAIDPVQVQCDGMDAEGLKRDFGDKLTFHGAIDTQQVLPLGTPEEAKAEVIRIIRTLAPGGGYILAPMHNVQPDVPPENLVAMCETVKEFGIYPIE